MHRVIQGQYAPGSIFKIVVAAAALEEEVVTPGTTVFCSGSLAIYDTVFRCNRPGGHGSVDMRRAIQHSCNVYFYRVGVQLGIERIANWARRLGLGRATGIDLPHEMSGLIPDPDWKQSTRGLPWYAGETVSVAIGQGQVLTTPLQLARLAAVMANGGMLVTPHLVLGVGGEPVPGPVPEAVGLHPETLRVIREGMHAVVNDHGSGWRAHLAGVGVSGKTGSAQVVSRAGRPKTGEIPRHLRAHGWFVAFAPSDDPQIALSVLVEHGESGGRGAAPVARRILLRYFGNKRGAPNSALEADQTDVD